MSSGAGSDLVGNKVMLKSRLNFVYSNRYRYRVIVTAIDSSMLTGVNMHEEMHDKTGSKVGGDHDKRVMKGTQVKFKANRRHGKGNHYGQ